MPYEIRKDGDKHCVGKVGDDKPMKCYDDPGDAEKYLGALNANVEDSKEWYLQQETVSYVPLSATDGQACANCRWFKTYGDEYSPQDACHIVSNWPDSIEPTGWCNRWEARPSMEMSVAPVPVVIVEPEAEGEASRKESLLRRAANVIRSLRVPDDTGSGVKVQGNHWIATWSNNFEDRDGEIFTEKAIDDYVGRVDLGIVPPPELWVWHAGKQTRIGQADWVARHDHFLIASGTFDDTPRGRKAQRYYQRHARHTKCSHGFTYPRRAFDGTHYEAFNSFEITFLPSGVEANRFTSLDGVKSMSVTPEKQQYLEEVFGKDEAKAILEDLQKKGKALEDIGAAYKDFSEPTDASDSASKDAAASVEASLKALIAEVMSDSAEVTQSVATFGKALQAMQQRLDTLEAENKSLRDELKLAPRASQSQRTVVENDKDTEAALREKDDAGGIDPIYGKAKK